jgi:hypothetical protein
LDVGVVVGDSYEVSADVTDNSSTTTPALTTSLVSSGSTGSSAVTTSAPIPCLDQWVVPFQEDRKRFCIVMQANITVTVNEV